MREIKFRYHSLTDFLISNELSIDVQLDDGAGGKFPLKGREIEATILFVDISGFSKMTGGLPPTGTLMFVNRFFTWITVDAFKDAHCIIDKYIGDEIMVVFSNEFGSEDHIREAFEAAFKLMEWDLLGYRPHVGLASGVVTVGFVGTPVHYNCSVFGDPVALAARCANTSLSKWKPENNEEDLASSGLIVFPADLWRPEVLQKNYFKRDWKELPTITTPIKNMGDAKLKAILKAELEVYTQSVNEDEELGESKSLRMEVEDTLQNLQKQGKYIPRKNTE